MNIDVKLSSRFIGAIWTILFIGYAIYAKAETNAVPSEPQSMSKEELTKAADGLEHLERQIQQATKNFYERPRRKFVGARTKDYQLALYLEKWREKVEKVGNENYPKAAAAEHIYGNVQVTVSIMSDGTIETMEINKSSGHKVLDDHVLETLKKGAPYERFNDHLKRDMDILSITRTWRYVSEPNPNGTGNWFVQEVKEQI